MPDVPLGLNLVVFSSQSSLLPRHGFFGQNVWCLMFDYITKWLSLFIRLMNYYFSKLLQEHTQYFTIPAFGDL